MVEPFADGGFVEGSGAGAVLLKIDLHGNKSGFQDKA